MTRDEPAAVRIIVTLPSGEEVSHLLPGGDASIGRNPDNTIPVDDPRVSRYHARVTISGRSVVVTDLGSRNGITVAGNRPSESATLAEHELVGIGESSFRFEWIEGAGDRGAGASHLAWADDPEPVFVDAPAGDRLGRALLAASGIGGILAIVGSFLTWGEADIPVVGVVTRSGMDEGRSGPVALVLGAAITLVALSAAWRPYLAPRAIINGLLAVALLVVAIRDARELQDSSAFVERVTLGTAETSLGQGLLIVFIGSGVTLILASAVLVVVFVRRRSAAG